jgi:hypothetical protein
MGEPVLRVYEAGRSSVTSLVLSAFLVALSLGDAAAQASDAIPFLGAPDFGWQTNIADWQDPPPGYGHGPIPPDPEHPYTSNYQAGLTGTQPTPRIGDTRDPILKPWAAAQMLATNEVVLADVRRTPFTSQSRCYPGGVPGQLLFPFEPLYFFQTENEVWMIWQRDHQIRRVSMNVKHSDDLIPSWTGESVGHYEAGNTLVIDTIGLSTEISYIDNFRTPHSEKLHVVERFTIDPDGQGLTAIVTVEDPDTFNAPLTMLQHWFKQPRALTETICAENDRMFPGQELFPIPVDETPDF